MNERRPSAIVFAELTAVEARLAEYRAREVALAAELRTVTAEIVRVAPNHRGMGVLDALRREHEEALRHERDAALMTAPGRDWSGKPTLWLIDRVTEKRIYAKRSIGAPLELFDRAGHPVGRGRQRIDEPEAVAANWKRWADAEREGT